ncbi:MAG: DUF6265 family protein [bacterium]
MILGLVTLVTTANPAATVDVDTTAVGPDPLDSLAWLTGCWAPERGEPGSIEQWLAPAGGTMLGVSRTVRGGETRVHEFMQLRTDDEGRFVFIAYPSGQEETVFALEKIGADFATFGNPVHDFPQTITYRSLSPGSMRVRIEGVVNDGLRSVEFPFVRIPCSDPTTE